MTQATLRALTATRVIAAANLLRQVLDVSGWSSTTFLVASTDSGTHYMVFSHDRSESYLLEHLVGSWALTNGLSDEVLLTGPDPAAVLLAGGQALLTGMLLHINTLIQAVAEYDVAA